jgi:hypothetical protein
MQFNKFVVRRAARNLKMTDDEIWGNLICLRRLINSALRGRGLKTQTAPRGEQT